MGLELDHAVGLVAFGETVTPIGITDHYEKFHDALGRLDANQGRTRLYDSLMSAARMLETHALTLPYEVKKRVFVLTDGADNASSVLPWQVASFYQENNITLDAVPLGDSNRTLECMCRASNGLCFVINSQEQGVGLFEREAVLHLPFREIESVATKITSSSSLMSLASGAKAVTQVKTKVAKTVHAKTLSASAVPAIAMKSNGATKRVLKEYTSLMRTPLPGWQAWINEEDMFQWKTIMTGPAGTPYENGNWLVTVEFPRNFPFQPPKVRFVTPIYHCNISSDGRLCLDILKDSWSPALTMKKVFQIIADLLGSPNPDDPIDAYKATLYKDDLAAYTNEAKHSTLRDASVAVTDMVAMYHLEE